MQSIKEASQYIQDGSVLVAVHKRRFFCCAATKTAFSCRSITYRPLVLLNPPDTALLEGAARPPRGFPPDPQKEFQVGDPSVAESRLYSAWLGAKAQPWCQANRPWCQGTRHVGRPGSPGTEHSRIRSGSFLRKGSNCQILCRSLELLVWCFQK